MKGLIRLCGCAGWSRPSLSAYAWRHVFAWRGPDEFQKWKKCSLTHWILGKSFSRRHFEIFSFISQKICFDISCKLSLRRQFAWNVKVYFLGNKRKSIWNNLSSAELAFRLTCSRKTQMRSLLSVIAGRNPIFWLFKERPLKTMIGRRGCAGWSESSLGAFTIRYIFTFRLTLFVDILLGKLRPKV